MGRGSDVTRHVVWRQRLERFADWTGTLAEFCRRAGVTQPTFYQWRKRLSLAGMPARSKGARSFSNAGRTVEHARQKLAPFVELSLAAGATVEIELVQHVFQQDPLDTCSCFSTAVATG